MMIPVLFKKCMYSTEDIKNCNKYSNGFPFCKEHEKHFDKEEDFENNPFLKNKKAVCHERIKDYLSCIPKEQRNKDRLRVCKGLFQYLEKNVWYLHLKTNAVFKKKALKKLNKFKIYKGNGFKSVGFDLDDCIKNLYLFENFDIDININIKNFY